MDLIENYIDLIKNVEHFSELTDSEIVELLGECEIIELDDDEILFKQNDHADAMYILISGYLLISVEHENHNIEHISSVHPGEVIGELGLFTNKPRSASAKALVKSKLIKLSSVEFFKFINNHPRFVERIIPIIADRAHYALRLATRIKKRPFHKHIMLIPFDEMSRDFVNKLKRESKSNLKIHYCEQEEIDKYIHNKDALGLLNYIDRLEKHADVIVYSISPDYINAEDKTIQVLFKRTNTLVFAHKGGAHSNAIKDTYQKFIPMLHPLIKTELILLWRQNEYINNTKNWLKQCPFNLHHHIHLNDRQDYQRYIRYVSGKAIGLVLSGGGSRVWHHLGVLQAIMEKKIPIDAVGGTSSGAVIGAYYLLVNDFDEMFEITRKFSKSIQRSLRLRNLTYPLISLFNAIPTTTIAKRTFHNELIEDLPLPYFAIATNMNTCSEYIMTKGLIWKAARATSALPGIYPPLEENGQILFDGGLLNNLPTDHMRDLLGDEATIIASDISIDEKDLIHYSIPPVVSLWEGIKTKFHLTRKKIIHPPFISTLIKALLVGSIDHYRRNKVLANYRIYADFSKHQLFIFDNATIKKLIKSGYDAANTALKDFDNS